jgi:hypothetical protein
LGICISKRKTDKEMEKAMEVEVDRAEQPVLEGFIRKDLWMRTGFLLPQE